MIGGNGLRLQTLPLPHLRQALAPLVAACPQKGSVDHCPIVNALSHPN